MIEAYKKFFANYANFKGVAKDQTIGGLFLLTF